MDRDAALRRTDPRWYGPVTVSDTVDKLKTREPGFGVRRFCQRRLNLNPLASGENEPPGGGC